MNSYRVFYKKEKGSKPPFKFVYVSAVSEKMAESAFRNDPKFKKYQNQVIHCVRPV